MALDAVFILAEHHRFNTQADLVISRHGDGNGRIEQAEFHEFVETSMHASKKREDRSKVR